MDVKDINIGDYFYPLPDERIAKHPLAERDRCKLLVRCHDGALSDCSFTVLPSLLPADSMLVYNNTRVINARLSFHKESGARIEVFCLEPVEPADYDSNFASVSRCRWMCFIGNSKRWKDGALSLPLEIDGQSVTLLCRRVEKRDNASVVEFEWNNPGVTFSEIVNAVGEIPIPPYLNRASEECDSRDYQTVYGSIEGSVAAPTAGLHFTPRVLAGIDARGVLRRELTLHVGAGTFQPVKSEKIGGHQMHREFISVPVELIEELAATSRKVVAVGTTSVRTLESLYHLGCMAAEGKSISELEQWYAYSPGHPRLSRAGALEALAQAVRRSGASRLVASTGIMIAPGYEFKVVDAIITNFHQPGSTLLLLVSAFTGGDWRAMYTHALDSGYRFLSYGDASLLL